jgi:hypothetical protein
MPLPIMIIVVAALLWVGVLALVFAACRSAAAADRVPGVGTKRHLRVVGRRPSQAVPRQDVRHGAQQNFEVTP